MDNDPYDLTRIKVHPDQLLPNELFPELPDPRQDMALQPHVKQHYSQQLCQAETIFDDIFLKVNKPIFEGVDRFVQRSLDESMFPDTNRSRIHAATLLLDMQTSDHESTFDKIEQQLKRFKYLHVQRIKSNLRRKRNLLELLETSCQSKKLFIMIEQAETLDTCLAETLVGNLYQRLQDDILPAEVIMILFCMSTKLQDLPIDSMGCFGRLDTIKRDTEIDKLIIKEHLFRSPNTTMKLGHEVLDYIYECYTNCDASIANIKFVFNYTLHEHCRNISRLGNFKLIASDSSKFAKNVQNYHDYLCDELYCYYELIRGLNEWPEDVTVLYTELLDYDDFAQSVKVYEAIKYSIRLQPGALLNRFQRIQEIASDFIKRPESMTNIIAKYKLMIENNETYDNLSTNLGDELLAHAGTLRNPLKMNFKDAYYVDQESIILATLDTTRVTKRFETHYLKPDPYFDIVCGGLLDCPSQISAHDLWHDVKEKLEIQIRKDREGRVKEKVIKTKQTPKKKSRTTKNVMNDDTENDEQITGIAKSIFLDLVATMEHQHLVKLVRRGGKGLLIKRAFWLNKP